MVCFCKPLIPLFFLAYMVHQYIYFKKELIIKSNKNIINKIDIYNETTK